jgi:porin
MKFVLQPWQLFVVINPNREHDRMGISYWYNGVSDDLKALVPVARLQEVQGGEIYYNAEITPWFHLTADLQVIQPETRRTGSVH